MKKYNEKMIIRNGKMIYAIALKDKSSSSQVRNHIVIEDGKVYFTDSWYSNAVEFDFNEEAHRIAKEIFVSELQTDIKRRILELKQLEEIFEDIGLKECISDSIINNSKILLELKQEVKEEINTAIKEQVRPLARKNLKKVENNE